MTIRLVTPVALGLAVLSDLACRSSDKIEATEPASVPQVTAIEQPTGARPIQLEDVEPSGTDSRQIVVGNDDLKLSEIRGIGPPILINGYMPLPNILLDMEIDNYFWSPFVKPGARFAPDFIHDRMWEDERKSVLLAPAQDQ